MKWRFPIFGHISAICGWILLQYGSFGSLWISSYTQGPKGSKSPKCESSVSDHWNQPGGLKPVPDRGNNKRDVKMACQSLLQISHCPLASGHMFGCSFLEVYELPGTFFTSWFTTDMRHPDIHGFWQKIYHWHHTICCSRTNRSYCRGDTYMMSTKFAQFLTPPCLVAYRIHATLFPLSFFWGPPST